MVVVGDVTLTYTDVTLRCPDDSFNWKVSPWPADWWDHSDDDDDTEHQQSLKIISQTFQQITVREFFSWEKYSHLLSALWCLLACAQLYRSQRHKSAETQSHSVFVRTRPGGGEVVRVMVILIWSLWQESPWHFLYCCGGLANKHEEGRFFCLN